MQIYKVINNNMVSVRNDKGQETMLKGLSIGFKKKPGDVVDEEKIEQRFVLENEMIDRRFNEIIVDIDKNVIDVCIDVISKLKEDSKVKLNDSIYVTIIDHVSNLIDRLKLGIKFDNSILWDIRRIYPNEYSLAKEAVKVLSEKLLYDFDENEANFITLHIVNAEVLNDMHETYQITNAINDICDIVSSDLHSEFSDDDYYYNRFVMHLRYMLERGKQKFSKNENSGNDVLDTLVIKYPQVWETVDKITKYINSVLKYNVSNEQQLYLMVHLVRFFE